MSIATNLQRLVDAKSDIADAITAKGGTVNSGDGFEEFPADIASIPSGLDLNYTIDLKATSAQRRPLNKKANVTKVYDIPHVQDKQWNTGARFNGYAVLHSDTTKYIFPDQSNYSDYYSSPMRWNEALSMWETLNIDTYSQAFSDGHNIYRVQTVTNGNYVDWKTYQLDETNLTWTLLNNNTKIGSISFQANCVWCYDGHIYYNTFGSLNSQRISRELDLTTGSWVSKFWSGMSDLYFYGYNVWFDGEDVYCNNTGEYYGYTFSKKLRAGTNIWDNVSWNGLTNFLGSRIWSDGSDVYYSYCSGGSTSVPTNDQYILNKSTNTWEPTAWNILTVNSVGIWHDSGNTYYSQGLLQAVLNKTTGEWDLITWNTDQSQPVTIDGSNIWVGTDGACYYSYYSGTGTTSLVNYFFNSQLVLDRSTSTWRWKIWNGIQPNGRYIWSDGDHIYYSYGSLQYVLDEQTSTWTVKTWNGLTSFSGHNVWSDNTNIYYSSGTSQYILDKETSTWSTKSWSGLTSFDGANVWAYGDSIYYSSGSSHYKLSGSIWSAVSSTIISEITGQSNFNGAAVWSDGLDIMPNEYDANHNQVTIAGGGVWSDEGNVYYSSYTKTSNPYTITSIQYVIPKCISLE